MDNNNKEQQNNPDTDITPAERSLLDESIENSMTNDSLNVKKGQLDNTDDEGVPLNEKSSADDVSGEDLDVPGAEEDDDDEMIGSEDEENNSYSQSDTE